MNLQSKECRGAYQMGFEDGQAAVREAMFRLINELEAKYQNEVYALQQALDHYTSVPGSPVEEDIR
jgi:hypothetical protein